VFASAREKARQASCESNLKQIGLATLQYVQDNDERMFPWMAWTNNYTNAYMWDGLVNYAAAGTANDFDPTKGFLQPYLKATAILDCPTAASVLPYDPAYMADGVPVYAAYGVNNYLLQGGTNGLPAILSQITMPASTVLLADAAIHTNNPKATHGIGRTPQIVAGGGDFHGRHSGMGNVLWMDGHVKAMKPVYGLDSSSDPGKDLGDIAPPSNISTDSAYYFELSK
jgi:prepilin-type processing-associated H-X9-DG protein